MLSTSKFEGKLAEKHRFSAFNFQVSRKSRRIAPFSKLGDRQIDRQIGR